MNFYFRHMWRKNFHMWKKNLKFFFRKLFFRKKKSIYFFECFFLLHVILMWKFSVFTCSENFQFSYVKIFSFNLWKKILIFFSKTIFSIFFWIFTCENFQFSYVKKKSQIFSRENFQFSKKKFKKCLKFTVRKMYLCVIFAGIKISLRNNTRPQTYVSLTIR